jgi:hypothetical protein
MATTNEYSPIAHSKTLARPRAGARMVTFWSSVGLLLIAFEGYTLLTWVTGPHFVATNPGSDTISSTTLSYYFWLQVVITGLAAAGVWYWIVRPWIRNGQLTTDGMMAISCWSLVFYDCSMNYTSSTVLYNSYLFNRGSWTLGSWWSWNSPNGNLLPEPLFLTCPGYLCLVFAQVLIICAVLRKVQTKWPSLGLLGILFLIVIGMTIVDSCIEIFLLSTGLYAYPGGIRALTLFAGHTYQFPLSEGFTFGGLGVGALTALRFFRNDKGQTWVERGIDSLKVGKASAQWLKFLAIFGYCHLTFIALFVIPNQWLALHSDPYPDGYPSYMINGLCVYGAQRDQCPGPGVLMPRQ